MRAIAKLIAIALPASLALAAACAPRQVSPEQAAPQTGIVTLPAEATLSVEPGQAPSIRPATNLALVLERHQDASRVLAADGRYGWIADALPVPAPVTIECDPETSMLFKVSPDQISPEQGGSQKPTSRDGVLLGASAATYPASQRELLAPARFRMIPPTLHVRCGVEGYAPPAWLTLRYGSPAFEALIGIVRRPFLGPFRDRLLTGAPPIGTNVTVFLEDQLSPQATETMWNEVHSFYRDGSVASRTLTVYGNGAARLYRFTNPDASLLFGEYQPYPVKIVTVGEATLIEVLSLFGDGAYSTLFQIGPAGQIDFRPLSRSSGESEIDVQASWGVVDGTRWIARASGGKVTLEGIRSLDLVVASKSPDYVEPLDPREGAFPVADRDGVVWLTALPFRNDADARRVAGSRQVLHYP
jgi:hypothetical protein